MATASTSGQAPAPPTRRSARSPSRSCPTVAASPSRLKPRTGEGHALRQTRCSRRTDGPGRHGEEPARRERPADPRLPLGSPARIRHHPGLYGHPPDEGRDRWRADLPGRLCDDCAPRARAGDGELRADPAGGARAQDDPRRAGDELELGLRGQPARQPFLRAALRPHAGAGVRDGQAADRRERGQDSWLRAPRRRRPHRRRQQGDPLQLDGHARRRDGAHLAVHDRQDRGDVAAHPNVLCPGLRALSSQHVRDPRRDAAGRAGLPRGLVDVESDPGDAGQALVFVATDDGAVNAEVASEGRRGGVWVNAADDPEHCDFILPSVLRRGTLTVAVSTGGTSPALARAIREELETYFTDDYRVLARLADEARRALRGSGATADADVWRRALDPALRRLIAEGREDEARARLLGRLRAAACA